MTSKIIFALAAIGALAACSSTPSLTAPGGTAADFGNSVDSLIKAQTADPATLTNPSGAPVTASITTSSMTSADGPPAARCRPRVI